MPRISTPPNNMLVNLGSPIVNIAPPKKSKVKDFAPKEPKLSVQNTRLASALPSVQDKFKNVGLLDEDGVPVNTGATPSPYFVMCKLDIKKNEINAGLVRGQKIAYYDICVMNALYTLWTKREDKSKKECDITYADVYRTMTGNTEKNNVRKSIIDQINESIDRLTCIRASVDTRNEIPSVQEKLESLGIRKNGITIDTLVSAKRFIKEARNHEIINGTITLRDCPILCAYAEAMGQVVQLPYRALDVREVDGTPKRKTEKFIAIQACLALHATSIRNEAISNKVIGVQTIIEKVGYDYKTEHRETKKRDREAITEILEHYVRIKFIKSFEFDKKTELITINV